MPVTVEQTKTILAFCEAEWPQSFRGLNDTLTRTKTDLWASMLAQDDFAVVSAAVKALMLEPRSFAPGIGEIKAKIRELTHPPAMTEAEAWGLVCKALKSSGYLEDARKAFEALPPTVRRVVNNPAQLQEWATMDSGTVHSVVASNFQRSYRNAAAQDEEYQAFPPDVKALASAYRNPALPEAAASPLSHVDTGAVGQPADLMGPRRSAEEARAVIRDIADNMRLNSVPVEEWRPRKMPKPNPEREAELRARARAIVESL